MFHLRTQGARTGSQPVALCALIPRPISLGRRASVAVHRSHALHGAGCESMHVALPDCAIASRAITLVRSLSQPDAPGHPALRRECGRRTVTHALDTDQRRIALTVPTAKVG